MQSSEIRKRFLEFFKKRGHAILESAPLVPLNDPSVLFNTAGMQPLVPYLMGEKHPQGTRLVSRQKCVRTGDLEDIGDNRHFSFFEMLGNWSLGDYFKTEALGWSYEFLTSKEEGLGLDPKRLAVTIFEGDENAPYDQESKDIWMKLGIPEHRIYALPANDNWWSPGDNGPCGPCSEMFYDMRGDYVGQEISHDTFLNLIDSEKFIEIWNDVFMEYEKHDGKVIGKLAQKNVDTGAGLERLTAVMQNKDTAYETDLFESICSYIKDKSNEYDEKSARIIADHFRTAVFLVCDGVVPNSKSRGYVLRRLIRRAIIKLVKIKLNDEAWIKIFQFIFEKYNNTYPELILFKDKYEIIFKEILKFKETLDKGMIECSKGTDPFILVTTYGLPIESVQEIYKENDKIIDMDDFSKKMIAHQKLSQSSSVGMFKGGLANTNEKTVQLHTAHHLLLAALQTILGKEIKQRGSNITEERLRIDFTFDRKLTDDEKNQIEIMVNTSIQKNIPVKKLEMKKEEAELLGAEMEFGAKYPDVVSIYVIEDTDGTYISKEFCGGPHVNKTGVLGNFKIQKEESVAQGVRRIKAVLK